LLQGVLSLNSLDGLVFELPALLLLFFSVQGHLLHHSDESSHVVLDGAHVHVEVVNYFESCLGLRNAQVFIFLDYLLYFDELLDFTPDSFDLLLLLSKALAKVFATQFTATTCVITEGAVIGVGAVNAAPLGEPCCVRGSVLPRLRW